MSHYFINDDSLNKELKKIRIKALDNEYTFLVGSGIFSKEKFDFGSRLLLESIPKNIEGNVLDLGCGYGPIGIILGKRSPNLNIDMVDINNWAIELTKRNIELNKVNNCISFISDVYSNVKKKYNIIITNPPIRAGKEIIRKFLFGASNYLEKNGSLYFVMRKDHGVKSMIKELENTYKIEIIEKNKGFYIIKCQKH